MYTDSDQSTHPVTVLTFDIECETESGLPDVTEAKNELTSIALHDNISNDYIVLIMDKDGIMKEKQTEKALIIPFETEEELCLKFLEIYEQINPDIITGWNIDYFDIPFLYNRLKRLLGEQHAKRLSPIGETFYSPYRSRWFLAGVSVLDYLSIYKKFQERELPNYRLDTVGKLEINKGKIEYEGNLDKLFNTDIDKFIEYNLVDVEIIVDLDKKLQFIELVRGICHVGHVPYEDFVYSSKYLEGSMLTYLRRRGLVAPNKPADRREKMKALKDGGMDKFIGAYVKDPIVGKYDWVYDLDLTSLYPSIIMTLNISPETKVGKVENWDIQKYLKKEISTYKIDGDEISRENFTRFINNENLSISSNGVLYKKDVQGCVAGILSDWFETRVEYKDLMKKYGKEGDDVLYKFYYKRQLIQKTLLNSFYGVLGLPAFRFYDIDNAEAVTTTGQTVIKKTAEMVNIKYNKELNTPDVDQNIYIDTDSVFFSAVPLMNVRYPNWKNEIDDTIAGYVNVIATEVQDYLNDFYDLLADKLFNVQDHRLEIKKEYVAKTGLWVAKKRYAQWIISDNGVPCDRLDVKGLDVKRSSFPLEFQKIMNDVLIDILKDKTEESITDKLNEFKKELSGLEIQNIAKNTAVKNLKKYIPKTTNAILQFKKGAPAHVKAAIAYNDLIKHYRVPYKYQPMRGGDKIKWVYLKTNPFGLDGLGFTGYLDPPVIIDFIEKYIDRDKIFERELHYKLQDFYDAIGWGNILSQQKAASQFFQF